MGRMSRCGFLSHCNRVNRCVELRLGLLLHGGVYGHSLCSVANMIVVFDDVVDFSSICSKNLESFFILCGCVVFNVVFLDALVNCRNGCVSKLVDHGRSVCSLLHTGCVLCDVTLLVPAVLVVPNVIAKGMSMLNYVT